MNDSIKRPVQARPSVLSLNISSKSALYAAYMPFLKNGGIFLPTSREYKLGDDVYVLLTLPEDSLPGTTPARYCAIVSSRFWPAILARPVPPTPFDP